MPDDNKKDKKKRKGDKFLFDEIMGFLNENITRWFSSFAGPEGEQNLDEALREFLTRPFVFGWSVSIGPDGVPRFQRFGSSPPKTGIFTPSPEREPLIDIYDLGDTLRVIVEIPGVAKENIKVQTEAKRVRISAMQGERKYSRVIDLPTEVVPDSVQAKYNYGVLEVTLKKVNPSEGEGSGVHVSIE